MTMRWQKYSGSGTLLIGRIYMVTWKGLARATSDLGANQRAEYGRRVRYREENHLRKYAGDAEHGNHLQTKPNHF